MVTNLHTGVNLIFLFKTLFELYVTNITLVSVIIVYSVVVILNRVSASSQAAQVLP